MVPSTWRPLGTRKTSRATAGSARQHAATRRRDARSARGTLLFLSTRTWCLCQSLRQLRHVSIQPGCFSQLSCPERSSLPHGRTPPFRGERPRRASFRRRLGEALLTCGYTPNCCLLCLQNGRHILVCTLGRTGLLGNLVGHCHAWPLAYPRPFPLVSHGSSAGLWHTPRPSRPLRQTADLAGLPADLGKR